MSVHHQWLPEGPGSRATGFFASGAGALLLVVSGLSHAAVPPSAKQQAPIDLTGTWVSLVTEDWRFRMVTPRKGDIENVPVNERGKAEAALWDPVADLARGDECKAYGAPAIMRVPGRVRVTWEGDDTLRLETDAGQQVRRFYFKDDASRSADASRQGYSAARWLSRPLSGDDRSTRVGSLRVDTSNLTPGYFRANGIPYSVNAKVTEYFNIVLFEDQMIMVVTTTVDDPTFLAEPLINSVQLKKEASPKWFPRPCELPTPVELN